VKRHEFFLTALTYIFNADVNALINASLYCWYCSAIHRDICTDCNKNQQTQGCVVGPLP